MAQTDPREPVRVRDRDTGYHLTITRGDLKNGNYTELKQDATHPLTGDFLPPDYNPTDGDSAGKKES